MPKEKRGVGSWQYPLRQMVIQCDVSLETLEHGLIWGNKVFMAEMAEMMMRSNGLPKSNSRCPDRGTTSERHG